MASIAQKRLTEERKSWRKDHPVGFWARPAKNPDGSTNLLEWNAGIPGKEGTPWEGGVFTIKLKYSEDFPSQPPQCFFAPVIFHPNVYQSGKVCLSILDANKDWKPSITMKQILMGVQDLLDSPNVNDPAQSQASELYKRDINKYTERIKKQAQQFAESADGVVTL